MAIAGIGFLVFDGFLVNQLGELSWHGWADATRVVTLGAADMISVVVRSSLLQLATPPEMRGRVSAVNQIFIGSSNEIGEFESGVVAKLMGTVPSVIFGGCMTLVTVGIIGWLAPKLRKLDLSTVKHEP